MMRTIVKFALFVATLASTQGLEAQNSYISQQDSLLQDYDFFFSQLEQIHPDPYSAFGGKDPESDYRPNPEEEDIRLIPVGFVNNNWKGDTTTDPEVFWAKP